MLLDARQVSELLSAQAREVCLHILPNGKKCGSQWQVGSVGGEHGKSLNVQLTGIKAGVWADFSSGERGDMLALWQKVRNIPFSSALEEACKFLGVQKPRVARAKDSKKEYVRPTKTGIKRPENKLYEYFESRSIPRDIVDFLKIAQNDKGAITFPFLRSDELLAMKFLLPKAWVNEEKNRWWKTADSEPCLWGWHGISEHCEDVVITEGEIDALSCYSVGFNALSIPSGANDIDSWIEEEFDRLQRFKTIRLCLDNDEPGKEATEKIAKRLGMHRVLFVNLKEKDANETLIKHGKEELIKLIMNAVPRDPEVIKRPKDYIKELMELLDPDYEMNGSKLPWEKCDKLFSFKKSDISLWTGYNGHGKTQLLNFVALASMAKNEKWMIYTPEMTPRNLLKRLLTQSMGKRIESIHDAPSDHIKAAIEFLNDKLFIYDSQRTEPIEKILEAFAYVKNRYNVNNFVIDSLQKCGLPEGGDGELQAQKRFMDRLCEFKTMYDCHIHLVAHPRKSKTDETIAPTKQDIKGSGSICDLVDNVLIVQRNKKKEEDPSGKEYEADVFLDIAKQRNGDWEGIIELFYCKQSYQYKSQVNEPIKRFYLM